VKKYLKIPWQVILIGKTIMVVIQQNYIIRIFNIFVLAVENLEFGRHNSKKDILKFKEEIFITNPSGVMNVIQSASRRKQKHNHALHLIRTCGANR